MILDTSSKSLVIELGEAATKNPEFFESHVDHGAGSLIPGSTDGACDGTNEVTLVPAPSAGVPRQIRTINICNADSVTHTVKVNLKNGTTRRLQVKTNLDPKYNLQWNPGTGWTILKTI